MRYTLRSAPGVGQGQNSIGEKRKSISRQTSAVKKILDRRQRLLVEEEVNDLILVKSEIDF